MPGRIAGSLAALAAGVAVFAAAGTGSAREASNLPVFSSVGITPSRLSPTKPTPVRMSVSAKYRTKDGSPVPALKELRLEGDEHIALDLEGVPPCRLSGSGVRQDHSDSCPESVVGRGRITVGTRFAGEQVIPTTARLTLWSIGRKRGGAKLLAYAFLTAPVTAELLIPVEVRRVDKGRIGWEARAAIPKISGGAGAITDSSLAIGKRFLSATCVDRRLELRARSTFVGGTRLDERFILSCAIAKADVRK